MLRSPGRAAAPLALALLLALPLQAAPQAAVGKAARRPAATLPIPPRPRLVVLISIDQFRADYLKRFEDLYLAPVLPGGKVGGFRWLMERGAYYSDAHHDHYPLYTGPGHSIHLTGTTPYKSGIVGNEWYDRELAGKDDSGKETKGSERYCVYDPAQPLVGAKNAQPGVSPVTLRASTVGDELEMATGRHAKVWGLGFKDRAAVLMAGRLADGAVWYDDETGNWVTSKFYRPDGTLWSWVADWNRAKKIDSFFGMKWKPRADARATDRLFTPDGSHASDGYKLGPKSAAGEYTITGGLAQPGKGFYKAFTATPEANRYVLDTARELIAKEGLGKDDVPDVLAINLSTNDYIGHSFGPDSAEVLDVAVATDSRLSDFFNDLGRLVPGGLARVTIVITADHGVAPIAEAAKEAGLPAGAYDDDSLRRAAESALDAAFGPGDWTAALVEDNLYLNLAALGKLQSDLAGALGLAATDAAEAGAGGAGGKLDRAGAEGLLRRAEIARLPARAQEIAAAALAGQPGIYAVYTRDQIEGGRLPATDIAQRVARSFHPKVSGEVVLVSDPYWVPGRLKGTTHGSPYAYDTSVPLLLGGFGIRPGHHAGRVSTLDIAPTLSELLGVLQPSGCEGKVLVEAVK